MLANLSIIVILCFMFGSLVESYPEDSSVKKNAYLIIPVLLMVFMFLKTMLIYLDALRKTCALRYEHETGEVPTETKQNNMVIFFNSLKILATVFIVYTALIFYAPLTKPFYELFNSNHPIIHYIAIGFWIGCACMPAETSIYFNILRSGCHPIATIKFKNVNTEKNKDDHSDDNLDENQQLSTETDYN